MTDLDILNTVHFLSDATDTQKATAYANSGLWDTTSEAFNGRFQRCNWQYGIWESEDPRFRYDDREFETQHCLLLLECAEQQYLQIKPIIAREFGRNVFAARYVAFVVSRAFYAWLLESWKVIRGMTRFHPRNNRSLLLYHNVDIYVCKDDDINNPYFCELGVLPSGRILHTCVRDELPRIHYMLSLPASWSASAQDENIIIPYMAVTMPIEHIGNHWIQFTSDIYFASTMYRFPEDSVRQTSCVSTSECDDMEVGVEPNSLDEYLESYRRHIG